MPDLDRGNHSWDEYLTITLGLFTAPRPSSGDDDIFAPIDGISIKHGLLTKAANRGFGMGEIEKYTPEYDEMGSYITHNSTKNCIHIQKVHFT